MTLDAYMRGPLMRADLWMAVFVLLVMMLIIRVLWN